LHVNFRPSSFHTTCRSSLPYVQHHILAIQLPPDQIHQSQSCKMASKTALSPPSQSVSAQKDRRSTNILDLPLEVRIMIYTEIITRPEHHYMIDQPHPRGRLPGVLRAHPQITREIYQFCTMTAVVRNKIVWERHESIFAFLSRRLLLETAAKLIQFNAKANHREAVLSILLRCFTDNCSEERSCKACRAYAERSYISPMIAMSLERRLITLL
jgi:hypothetical protein